MKGVIQLPVIQGVSFPDSSQIGPLSVVTWPSTVAHTLVASTVAQTLEHKTLSVGVGMSILADASTSDNILNYGVSRVTSTTGGGKNKYTLAPPAIGVEKMIWTGAAGANSSDYANIYSGSTAIFFCADGTDSALFVGLKSFNASVRLVGRTTAVWHTVATHGTVAFSTA